MDKRKLVLWVNALVIGSMVLTLVMSAHVAFAADAWEIVSSPYNANYINQLFGVTAIKSNCSVAVGSSTTSTTSKILTERWNGTSWSTTSPSAPSLAELFGVTRVPSGNPGDIHVYAVGYQSGTGRNQLDTGVWDADGAKTLVEYSGNCGQTWSNIPS